MKGRSDTEISMPEPELQPIDLLLGQGTDAARARLRQGVAADPLLALELADTVTLIERCQQLRVEAGPRFAGKLMDVVQRAQRRLSPAPQRPWLCALAGAAAAVLTFLGLKALDPMQRAPEPVLAGAVLANAVLAGPGPPAATAVGDLVPARDDREVRWEATVDAVRRRLEIERAPQLTAALEAGLEATHDPLRQWLDPRNSLVLMRLDHELRAHENVRRHALRSRGGLAATDAQVQELADDLAFCLLTELLGAERVPGDLALGDSGAGASALASGRGAKHLPAVALAVRGVLAAGPGPRIRARAIEAAGGWLAAQLPTQRDAGLVAALSALIEVVAIADRYGEVAAKHGDRLVEEMLQGDDDTWWRRRPQLLDGRIDASTLGDAGRLFACLPGLGVDATRCALARQLVLGQLRERRARGVDGPEIPAALLFGGAEILAQDERQHLEMQLRRWQPARLAPDYRTVQQMAWAIEPGRFGFTRLQAQLRQLSLQTAPAELADRAAFCLCLATNFAAFAGGSLQHFAAE